MSILNKAFSVAVNSMHVSVPAVIGAGSAAIFAVATHQDTSPVFALAAIGAVVGSVASTAFLNSADYRSPTECLLAGQLFRGSIAAFGGAVVAVMPFVH